MALNGGMGTGEGDLHQLFLLALWVLLDEEEGRRVGFISPRDRRDRHK